MLTCEPVLAEAAYLLGEHAGLPSQKLLALFERKVITAPFSLEAHAGPVAHLLEKDHDQGMQLADGRPGTIHRPDRPRTACRDSRVSAGKGISGAVPAIENEPGGGTTTCSVSRP